MRSQDDIDAMNALRMKGLTYQAIGERFGVTPVAIWYLLHRETSTDKKRKWRENNPGKQKRMNRFGELRRRIHDPAYYYARKLRNCGIKGDELKKALDDYRKSLYTSPAS